MNRISQVKRTAGLWVTVGAAFLGMACQLLTPNLGQTPTSGTTQAAATPRATLNPPRVPTLIPSPSSPEALAACSTDQQQTALRPDQAPDWNSLGIDACYQLELDLSEGGPDYRGKERLTLTNLTGSELTEIIFRLYPNSPNIYGGSMEVTSASVNSTPLEPEVFLEDQTGLRLPLIQDLAPGETAVVEMEFEGHPPEDMGTQGGYGIFNYISDGPAVVLANWYPLLAEWDDGGWVANAVIGEGDAVVSRSAFYDVQVTAPADWKIITSGSLAGEDQQNDTRQSRFASGPVREFMLVAGPLFTRQESSLDDISIVHWGLSGTEESWDKVLEVAIESLDTYAQYFGEYPYKELDIVAVPLRYASGVEYPGLILIEGNLYSGPEAATYLPVVVSHEAAHQWWYAVVGNDILESPWQDEALATYSSLLHAEIHNPAAYRIELAAYKAAVAAYEDKNGSEPIARPLEDFQGRSDAYSTIVYLKGALFFVEVRKTIGDDAFFQALQNYYYGNRFDLASPEELLDAFEAACGCNLDELYQEWGVTD